MSHTGELMQCGGVRGDEMKTWCRHLIQRKAMNTTDEMSNFCLYVNPI